jgi:eukaryotic-like serine/threonine-protein kinase
VSRSSKDPEGLVAGGNFVQAARLFESRHRLDEAVDAYAQAEAWNDAARVLSHQGRFREAGETLLYYLPSDPTPVGKLAPDVRRHALNAALCFARGGARREAVGLLMNLGEHQKAASLLSMAGMRQDAVKAMRGQPIEGSPWPPGVVFPLKAAPGSDNEVEAVSEPFEPAQAPRSRAVPEPESESLSLPDDEDQPSWTYSDSQRSVPTAPEAGPLSGSGPPVGGYEAMPSGSIPAVAYSGSGSFKQFEPQQTGGSSAGRRPGSSDLQAVDVNSLLEIRAGDERLPHAVIKVLQAKWLQEPLSPRILQFLDRYVEAATSGAFAPMERATFYAIARLYEYHDRMGSAKKAYGVAASAGGIADAPERLQRIEEGLVETASGTWLPLNLVVDGLHHQFASLPSLADLPSLGGEGGASRADPGPRSTHDPHGTAEGAHTAGRSGGHKVVPNADETMDFDDYMASLPPSTPSGRPSGARHARRQSVSRSGAWSSSDDLSALDRSIGDSSDSHHGPITEGSVVADRYRIESFIGQGGMATVYKATDMELEEAVALKVFQQVVQNRSGLERFRREMKLSRKLIHPNVVRIYEFGTWRGARYITMELLYGNDLEEHMKKADGPLDLSQGLSLMMQACDGLGQAHRAGVVHRDVKPQNLFVVEDGKRLKVMDFGIAKVSNSTNISITGVRVGTPRYMAPEQIQGGGEVGPPADLYALGGVMYEIFTGSPVFEEEELVPLLLNHMTEEPEPPTSRNPDVPQVVEDIILKLLAKNPEERYKDCSELKRELLSAYVQAERLPRR